MTGRLAGLTVAVAGLGPMGRGIARVFDRAGATVVISDISDDATRAGLDRTRGEAQADGDELGDVTGAPLEEAVAGADVFIEAVVEDMAVKEQLLATVRDHGRPDLVVASNTSSLSIGEMGKAFGDPSRVIGLHFFNPPTKMRLVEVIRGAGTGADVHARALEIVAGLGKIGVTCADSPNFVVNRVCRPLYYEAQLLAMQGVEPAVVDSAARGALGHRMGPLELLDFTGLHTHLASSETALREFGDPRYRPIPRVRGLVRNGMTGKAVGRGFYHHDVESTRDARIRVTRAPQPAGGIVLDVRGPDAGVTTAHPAVATLLGASAVARLEGTPADVTVYSCHRTPTAEQVREVRELAATTSVVVDSSDGAWLHDLPAGAGWVRVHTGRDEVFAEVVADEVAMIGVPAIVPALLDALGATSVVVPAALPGLVADRLAFCLVNEAFAVVEEGTATAADVDTALRLAMNHPLGPFELAEQHGIDVVHAGLRSLLDGLADPRYRPAPLMRRRDSARARSR
jgi:3-hydroxybutyryl-CoA dehydrogenase